MMTPSAHCSGRAVARRHGLAIIGAFPSRGNVLSCPRSPFPSVRGLTARRGRAAKRFTVTTLGCKVNQYDGAAVAAALARAGLAPAEGQAPDLLVVNTCCVTAAAMRKSRQAIRSALRNSPHAAVLVTGCYGDYNARAVADVLDSMHVPADKAFIAGHHGDLDQALRQVVRSIAGRQDGAKGDAAGGRLAEAAVGSRRVGRYIGGDHQSMSASLPECRTNASDSATIKQRRLAAVKDNVPGSRRLGPVERFEGRRRAFVKVQDGCDAFCAYCVVPFLRCNVYSRPAEQILAECRDLVASGHREIVLAGVFLGAFGRSTTIRRRWPAQPSELGGLVRRIAAIDGLWRLRLSSLEAGDLTEELIDVLRGLGNFAPHFHLPLQSGSPEILRRMNRQYTIEEYRRAVDRVRAALDRPALTTDVIVGFPGESDEDFAATLDAARAAGFAKIHAFPFSPIEPTTAWVRRSEAPPPAVVKRRMAALAELEAELAGAYRRQFLGRTVEALVEGPAARRTRTLDALTDRYLTVRFAATPAQRRALPGRIVRLRLTTLLPADMAGELVEVLD